MSNKTPVKDKISIMKKQKARKLYYLMQFIYKQNIKIRS